MRLLTYSFAVFALFCLSVFVMGQDDPAENRQERSPSTLRAIELGMTQGEVRERWGSPHTIYLPSFQESDFADREDYDWGVHALRRLSDAFRRKTAKNEYDVRVYYALDRRRDSDDPEIRVINVELKPAKLLPLLPTLKDLPEAFELCRAGCEVWGNLIGPSVVVFPQYTTLRQRRIAAQVAYTWRPIPPEDRDDRFDWTPVVEIKLKKVLRVTKRTVYGIEWMERPVEKAKLQIDVPRRWLEFDDQRQAFVKRLKDDYGYKTNPHLYEELRIKLGPHYLKLGTFEPGSEGDPFIPGGK